MRIVSFLGYSGSGKTRAIAFITKALTKKGKRVGTLKHIHDSAFTIDTEGKDTWFHAQAGAKIVVAVAPRELTIIRKGGTRETGFNELVRIFKDANVDYLLVEGLYQKLSERRGVVRILCARNEQDVEDLLSKHRTPEFILINERDNLPVQLHGIPVLSLPDDTPRAVNLIG